MQLTDSSFTLGLLSGEAPTGHCLPDCKYMSHALFGSSILDTISAKSMKSASLAVGADNMNEIFDFCLFS